MGERKSVKRGDIYLVDLNPAQGSETQKIRPGIIIQNDIGNEHSPITIIAPITSNTQNIYPTDVAITLDKPSKILWNQIRVIDKKRIIKKIDHLDDMRAVDQALKISLGLVEI